MAKYIRPYWEEAYEPKSTKEIEDILDKMEASRRMKEEIRDRFNGKDKPNEDS